MEKGENKPEVIKRKVGRNPSLRIVPNKDYLKGLRNLGKNKTNPIIMKGIKLIGWEFGNFNNPQNKE